MSAVLGLLHSSGHPWPKRAPLVAQKLCEPFLQRLLKWYRFSSHAFGIGTECPLVFKRQANSSADTAKEIDL